MRKLIIIGAILGIAFWAYTVLAADPFIFLTTQGGTGWGNIQSNTLLTGNGTSRLATTTVGSGLTLSGGVLSASGGSGNVATSTTETSGFLSYWTSTGATPATLGQVATGTVSATSPISVTAGRSVVGGALSIACDVASGSIPGCLAAADWTTFNNKQATISVNEPITLTGATVGFNTLFNFSTTYGSTTWPIINTGTITATSGVSSFYSLKSENTFTVTPLTSALTLTDANGLFAEYSGTSCTNQFPRSLNALGIATCATVGSADVAGLDISADTNLAVTEPIILTDDTLSFAWAYPFTATTWGGITANSTTTPLLFNLVSASSSIGNLTTGTITATSSLTVPSLTSALILTNANGLFAEYTGIDCTNQFVRDVSALGAGTCATVGTADVSGLDISDDTNLAVTYPIILTDDTLSFGWSYPFTPAIWGTINVNSTSTPIQFGSTVSATSSIGKLTSGTITATSSLTIPPLTSALILTDAGGLLAEYTGTSCTNQFPRSLSALGAATCATVANTDLANSSLTYTAGAGLTGGGTVALGASADLAVGAGTCITVNANDVAVTSNCTDSATVDSLNAADFLRSNASDEFETGNTLTVTGTLDSNGNASFADTAIAFDGATTEFTTTGNFSINTDDIFIDKTTGKVGIGTTSPAELLAVHGNSLISGTSTVGNLIATSTAYTKRINLTNDTTTGIFSLIDWSPTIDTSGAYSVTGINLSPNITVDQLTNFKAINIGAVFTRSITSLFTNFQLLSINLTDTVTADVLPWALIALSDNSIQQYDSVIASGISQIMVQNVKNLRANISAGTANVPDIVGFKDTPLLGSLTSGGTLLVAERKGIEIKDVAYNAIGNVTLTENKGIQIDNMALSATNRTVSNIYGINSDLVKGTNRWFLYGASTASSTLGGYLGIGTTTGVSKYSLAVDRIAGGNQAGTVLVIGTTTTGQLYATGTVMMVGLLNTVTSQTALCIDANGFVTKNGSAQTCTVSSQRFKHDIKKLTYTLDTISQLNPVSFIYNGSNEQRIGFIAEEVYKIDPRLVTLDEKGLPRTVNYESITSVLTKAIQDLIARVFGLEGRMNQQDEKIKLLEQRLNKLEYGK